MLNLKIRDGEVYVNNRLIVNLNTPFKRYLDKRIQKYPIHKLLKNPRECTTLTVIQSFNIQIDERYVGNPYITWKNDLRTNALYKASEKVSYVFRSKAVEKILFSINEYEDIKIYLRRIFYLILKTCNDIDIILTDIPDLRGVTGDTEVELIDLSLINTLNIENSKLKTVIQKLIDNHGKIPLRACSHEILNQISIENTDIDVHKYKDKKILLMIGQNKYYSGFLFKKLYDHVDYTIPYVLFLV